MDYFANSAEHLLAELERIDLLIQARVARVRQLQVDDEQFRGLYISEQELDALLKQPVGRPHWFQGDGAHPQLESSLNQLQDRISLRKEASVRSGIELRLDYLRHLFHLDPFEVDALLVCAAVELDLRYEKLYAYLQDDVTKKKPTVDLVLNLLVSSPEVKLKRLQGFGSNAPLISDHLLEFSSDPAQPDPPLLARYLKVDGRIARYLLGSDEMDERIHLKVKRIRPRASPEEYGLDERLMHRFRCRLQKGWASGDRIVHLTGPYGVGKQCCAEVLSGESGLNLLVVDLEQLVCDKDIAWEKVLRLINREALLQRAAIYWKGFDTLLDQQHKVLFDVFLRNLGIRRGLTFLVGETAWQPSNELRAIPYIQVELLRSTFEDRSRIWWAALNDDLPDQSDLDLAALATKFKFTGGQIQDAAATAKNLARWGDQETGRVTMKDLYEACRVHSNQKLSTLARKITPNYEWEDIVLPPDRVDQLREICNFVKYRDRVYGDWGFDGKLALGKGLSVLFAGPSGTGKTMAADIIGGALGLDLYKIDLSTVISKYIGETEKNLSQIFNEAETSNAILFFDEADALFGKRSEVKDSHDRYANIEIGYLLQRMEEYEGVVILATNFRKNMDEAFVRRLHFTVEFPFPNERDRRRIWDGVWPEETPRDPDLDFEFIARRFEVSGGNIRNIALGAAFLAADNSEFIDMNHLIRATQREYRKMGKVISDGDFSQHANSSLTQ